MAETIPSRRKRQARGHKPAPVRVHRQSISTISSHDSEVDAPNVEELRRVRGDFYNKGSEDRHEGSSTRMVQPEVRKTRSRPKEKSTRESNSTAREARSSKHHSERRRRRRPKGIVDGDSTAFVYKHMVDGKVTSREVKTHATSTSQDGRKLGHASDRIRILGIPSLAAPEGRSGHVKRRKSTAGHSERRLSDSVIGYQKHSRTSKAELGEVTTSENPRPRISRSSSMRESHSASISRPSLMRSHTTTRKVPPASHSQPAISSVPDKAESISSVKRADRSSGFFGSIFGLPKIPESEEKQIECLTCLSDDIPISKSAKLACGHRMCHACLRRIFTMSVTDPAHMPPKCCTADHIPLKHVDKLFDLKFKVKWNKKYQEYTTNNRIYCPAKGCGEWIKPANIHIDTSGGANGGRKYGKCSRCKTKVCTTCNGKWHTSRECPKDEATARFAEIAKKEGWQRCFNCSATVELKEGCNHMTCRCRAEFCMICGVKWKSCDCPWFNYEAVENDRLNHMNIPQLRREAARGGNLPRAYHEELERRREQERTDEALARRMQILGLDGGDNNNDVFAAGIAAGHIMNQDFVNRAARILTGTYGRAQADAANRMVTEANAARLAQRMAPPPPPAAAAAAVADPNPAVPAPPPLLRQHSTASRLYNNAPQTRASERVVPRRVFTDYATEAARHRPPGAAVEAAGGTATAGARPAAVRDDTRHSAMAGLTRNTTEGRVDEWRRYVEDDGSVPV